MLIKFSPKIKLENNIITNIKKEKIKRDKEKESIKIYKNVIFFIIKFSNNLNNKIL